MVKIFSMSDQWILWIPITDNILYEAWMDRTQIIIGWMAADTKSIFIYHKYYLPWDWQIVQGLLRFLHCHHNNKFKKHFTRFSNVQDLFQTLYCSLTVWDHLSENRNNNSRVRVSTNIEWIWTEFRMTNEPLKIIILLDIKLIPWMQTTNVWIAEWYIIHGWSLDPYLPQELEG